MEEEKLREKEKGAAAASISLGHPVLSLHPLHPASKQPTSPANPSPATTPHSGVTQTPALLRARPHGAPLPHAAPRSNSSHQNPAIPGHRNHPAAPQLPLHSWDCLCLTTCTPSPSKPADTPKPFFPNGCSLEAQPSFHFQTSLIPSDICGVGPEPEVLEMDFDDFSIFVF